MGRFNASMVLRLRAPKKDSLSEFRDVERPVYPSLPKQLFVKVTTIPFSKINYLKIKWCLTYKCKNHIIFQR